MDAIGGAQGRSLIGRRPLASLLVLLILIALGYWLRVHNLDAFSFWTDEGLTPERSGYPMATILRNDIVIQGIVTKDTHPPLYYLLLHVTRQLFGLSDFAFRYPSALLGVLFIPLIYRLGRRMGGRGVGLIVASLAAVNPLQVAYSQEARMYTLLVALVTGMSVVLWEQLRVTNGESGIANDESGIGREGRGPALIRRRLALYGLLAALAVYTHYTAVFVVAAQALFWVWILWRSGLKRGILVAAALLALVAIPLIPYTVPRLLSGAEANYYAVAPLTMALDVVRFFHLGLTVDFARPIIIALNTLAFALCLLGLWASARVENQNGAAGLPVSGRLSRRLARPLFLLGWLLAPVLGLMLGSALFKPMYQGVRHIMAASPAYLLALAFGLNALRGTSHGRRARRGSLASLVAPLAAPIAILIILAGAALSLSNLYNNASYVKDDFRAIVRFIETRAGGRDVVVYNNAVLLPLHEHYRLRDNLPATALPVYPQVATGHEPELAALAQDYDRIWFITDPPADGRDDDRLIQGWLDDNQTAVINRLFPARTTEARVIAYSTAADTEAQAADIQPSAPSPATPYRLGQLPLLSGAAFADRLALPTLWVDLTWRGARPAATDVLRFSLTGPDGAVGYRETRPLLPTRHTRWDDAAANRLSYDLPLPPGLPPGSYTLSVAPEGATEGDGVALGQVAIAPTSEWPVAPERLFAGSVPAAGQSAVAWSNGLSLAAAVPWDDAVLPGNNLPLTLYWRVGPAGVDLAGLRYRLELIDGRGRVIRDQADRPGAPWLDWVEGGALLREDTGIYIRPDTAPGDYRLRWTLLDGDTPTGRPQTHGRIAVRPWPLETAIPPGAAASEARFGEAIRLAGYEMADPADGALRLTLYWQATAAPADYTVFVHLVNEAGDLVSQVDSVPAGGARPTSGWRAGEVITDSHDLPIPDGLPPGDYYVNIGLYDPGDGARPIVTLDGTPQPDNQLRLATPALPWRTP